MFTLIQSGVYLYRLAGMGCPVSPWETRTGTEEGHKVIAAIPFPPFASPAPATQSAAPTPPSHSSLPLYKRVQHRLGVLQVSGVESFGKPAVDVAKYLTCFLSLPVLVPESSQAGG